MLLHLAVNSSEFHDYCCVTPKPYLASNMKLREGKLAAHVVTFYVRHSRQLKRGEGGVAGWAEKPQCDTDDIAIMSIFFLIIDQFGL